MKNCNYNSTLCRALIESPKLAENPFKLLDIGASGGISPLWRQLLPHLSAVGFDPLVNETDRLNREEENPAIRYEHGWITCHESAIMAADDETLPSNASFENTSAIWAAQLSQLNYTQEYFNAGQTVKYSDRKLTVDEYVKESGFYPDFIKIDTDGHDYFVLNGGKETFSKGEVLGVEIECQFHGNRHEHANLFSNIDLYMRRHGFTLYDLDCWHYTRRDMPGEFYYAIPAQTRNGQIQWAEALYLIDPFSSNTTLDMLCEPSRQHQLVKLLALFDLYGQRDSSAALINLLTSREVFIEGIHYPAALDCLVPENRWGIQSYEKYLEKFKSDPSLFYPQTGAG